jgi:hypothetical protein
VQAQRQLVDVLEQHRQAIGRRDRHGEGVQPRLQRLVVQEPRAEAVDGVDGELLEATVQPVLDAGTQLVGGRLGERQGQHALRRQAAGARQPGVAGQQGARLPRSRGAHDEQRAAPMGDHPALNLCETGERFGHDPRI